MRRSLILLGGLILSGALGAAAVEPMAYKDDAELQAVWKAANGESAAPTLRSTESRRFARFDLPFTKLKDWRFNWDLSGRWDLSKAERIVLTLRASSAGATRGILYAHSGNGWYALPVFGIGDRFGEVVLDKALATREEQPGGWDQVDTLRLSLLPGSGGDAWADLASIQAEGERPETWVWQVGGAKTKEQCFKRILDSARGQAWTDARRRLTKADGVLSEARRKRLRGPERSEALREARALVAEAYALSQKPLKPGFRGAWVHYGDGPRGRGGQRAAQWKDAIPAMRAMGLNAVLPNVLWSGVAFYKSELVPQAKGVATEGDYLQQILDAAKPLGMQVHAWKVMWQFAEGWLAEPGVSEPFRKAGRLQKDSQGKEQPWLCPCDERNRRYELDALLEVATQYPVDGVHLDYIRFESPEAGFGDACKERYEKWSGKTLAAWPADCAPGGPLAESYGDFKRDLISTFVEQASGELRKARPGLTISAAVFAYPDQARRAVFQDWPLWVQKGWVDYVCPMTYTEDAASFAGATGAQAALVGGDKLQPGIQVVYDGGRTPALESLVDQLKAADKLTGRGVTLFEWREHLQDTVLPYVRAGLWREGAYKLTLREVPASLAPKAAEPGQALEGEGDVLVDDFEDGNLVSALRTAWAAEADSNGLGSRLEGQPLRPSEGGAGASKHALGLKGHYGKNKAPWPYASLSTGFNPDRAPADLRPFQAIRFKARGDGKPLEVVLRRKVVTDFGDFRASVSPGADWAEFRIALGDFAQPGWAEPVPAGFADATLLIFQPGGRDDQDFWFEIDDVEFVR